MDVLCNIVFAYVLFMYGLIPKGGKDQLRFLEATSSSHRVVLCRETQSVKDGEGGCLASR